MASADPGTMLTAGKVNVPDSVGTPAILGSRLGVAEPPGVPCCDDPGVAGATTRPNCDMRDAKACGDHSDAGGKLGAPPNK